MVAMNIDVLDYIREVIDNKMKQENIVCDVLTYTLETISQNLIVVEETNNKVLKATLKYEETTSYIPFEINIYCPQDEIISTVINENTENEEIIHETITKMQQARTISKKIDEALGKLRLKRTLCKPTPNIDTSIYRITMRYDSSFYNNRNKFF